MTQAKDRQQATANHPTAPCCFGIAWRGPCGKPSVLSGVCDEHAGLKCASCGNPAMRQCDHTGIQFVCGAPLCNDCEHGVPPEGQPGMFTLGGGHHPKAVASQQAHERWGDPIATEHPAPVPTEMPVPPATDEDLAAVRQILSDRTYPIVDLMSVSWDRLPSILARLAAVEAQRDELVTAARSALAFIRDQRFGTGNVEGYLLRAIAKARAVPPAGPVGNGVSCGVVASAGGS